MIWIQNIFLESLNIILESNEDIGIRSTKSNINIIAPKGNISIGERNAQEAVIKGTSFNVQLESLLKNIEILCDALLTEASLVSTPGAAQALKLVATEFKDNLATLLSDKVKISWSIQKLYWTWRNNFFFLIRGKNC